MRGDRVGSALVRPDVELLQRRWLTGRVDGPLDVIQIKAVEGTLSGLQVEIAKTAERASEFEAVVGVPGIRDPFKDLDPAGVERIGPARGRADRATRQEVVGASIRE